MADNRPVALVTGAGSGIGLACARQLAARGYRLALTGRRVDPLTKAGESTGGEEGTGWAALPADVGVVEQATGLVGRAVDLFGRIDAVVNCAGWAPLKPVGEHSAEDVASVFKVNATGPILITISAIRAMASRGGRIVNVSSMSSADPFPGLSVYGAAKASLNTLTKGVANELGPDSAIRVFSIAPGAVETPLLRSFFSKSQLPAEACLTPDEVAEVIVACAAGDRDAETGKTIWVPSP